MTYEVAPDIVSEFDLRFYRWAKADLEQQLAANFDLARRIRSSALYRTLEYLDGLPEPDRRQFAFLLVRRAHRNAAAALGEELTPEEEQAFDRFHNQPLMQSRRERLQRGQGGDPEQDLLRFAVTCLLLEKSGQLPSSRPVVFPESTITLAKEILGRGDKNEIARIVAPPQRDRATARAAMLEQLKRFRINKARLKTAVKARLSKLLGGKPDAHGPLLDYDSEMGTWCVITSFDFGGLYQMRYDHNVCSRESRNITVPTGHTVRFRPPLARMIDIGRWSGLINCAWDLMTNDDLEEGAEVVANCCERFMTALPGLLDGLECKLVAIER